MFKVSLTNGYLLLRTQKAVDRIEEISLSGDLWAYISVLVENDVNSSDESLVVQKLDEVLKLITSGAISSTPQNNKAAEELANVVETVKNVIKLEELPKGGSALSALQKMKSLNKK